MNPEEISITSMNPFVRRFVFSIIQSIRVKNFSYEEKHVIHADMVPKTSEKVMQASLKERVIPKPIPKIEAPAAKIETAPTVLVKRRDMSHLIAPIQRPRAPRVRAPQAPPQIRTPQIARPQVQQIARPVAPEEAQTGPLKDYGKITPLLNDPSVSTIECHGSGSPIMIVRAGQKQRTKIKLGKKDIRKILEKISDEVHIPLLEGVFRAAVGNFSINAVISDTIGSRFVIKKQNAYAMLEQ